MILNLLSEGRGFGCRAVPCRWDLIRVSFKHDADADACCERNLGLMDR